MWEERRARPEWGREMDMSFAQAINEDKVLKLKVLNEGFSDPQLISLAYYQASLVVDHIVETYGEPQAARSDPLLWRRLRDGDGGERGAWCQPRSAADRFRRAAREAVRLAAQVAPDAEVREQADARRSQEAGGEQSGELRGADAARHGAAPGEGSARARFRRSSAPSKLAPTATGDNNPNKMIAAIAAETKDVPRQIQALDDLLKVDSADIESARQLATLLAPLKDDRRSEEAYRRVVGIDPFDREAQAAYGRLALKRKDDETAQRAFRAALARNPPDRATAHVDLAEALRWRRGSRPRRRRKFWQRSRSRRHSSARRICC